MNKIMVGIPTSGRSMMLDLTMDFFGNSPDIDFFLFNDKPSDVSGNVRDIEGVSLCPTNYSKSVGLQKGLSKRTMCDMMLGLKRKDIFNMFLDSKGKYKYLFMKDDDILLTKDTLLDSVKLFDWLKENKLFRVGALTLHGTRTHHGMVTTPMGVISELNITGEANVLFEYESACHIGNDFGPSANGFADNQFEQLRRSGYNYYDRIYPCMEVQHLGFGENGSVIYEEQDNKPFWTKEPYVCEYSYRDYKKQIQVKNFDLSYFIQLNNEFGCNNAVNLMIERLKNGS